MNEENGIPNMKRLERLKKHIDCLPSAADEGKSLEDKIGEIVGVNCHFYIQQLVKILPDGGAYDDQDAATVVLELIVLLETIQLHFLEKKCNEVNWSKVLPTDDNSITPAYT